MQTGKVRVDVIKKRGYLSTAHPLALLLLGLSLTAFGLRTMLPLVTNVPITPPAAFQHWPSTIGAVVRCVDHGGGRTSSHSIVVEYSVDGKKYRFHEDAVSFELACTEVRYDEKNPSHFYRVPLNGEAGGWLMPAILFLLFGFIDLSFAIERMTKSRNSVVDRALSWSATTMCILWTGAVLYLFYFCFAPTAIGRHDQYGIAYVLEASHSQDLRPL